MAESMNPPDPPPTHDITQMLHRWSEGDNDVMDALMPLLYDQMKRQARMRLRRERANHTLNTTGLVHEAYLRLIETVEIDFENRTHFLALASRIMRRILIDYARARRAEKRGGDAPKLPLRDELIPSDRVETMLDLDDALNRLEDVHPRQANAVELHYFGGLTLEQAGEVLDVSPATVMRDLRFAEAWLSRLWNGDLSALRND